MGPPERTMKAESNKTSITTIKTSNKTFFVSRILERKGETQLIVKNRWAYFALFRVSCEIASCENTISLWFHTKNEMKCLRVDWLYLHWFSCCEKGKPRRRFTLQWRTVSSEKFVFQSSLSFLANKIFVLQWKFYGKFNHFLVS